MRSLLNNPSLVISALQDLPGLFFPSLFLEACAGGHTEVLKAMVQAWPLPCLPLGDLTKSPDLETFKAILDGIDLLLAKKERPSGWKLQVLDLQNEHPEIWTRGYHYMAQVSYQDILTERATKSHCSRMSAKQPLVISVNMTIKCGTIDDLQAYLLQWALERKEQIQIFSRKVQILSDSIFEIQKALLVVRLDSIHELVVSKFRQPETLNIFAPYLGQMKNLHFLNFSNICDHLSSFSPNNFWYSCKLGEHLGQLQHLQELHVHDCFFFGGDLAIILNNLAPLKTLSLSCTVMEESDLWFLSQSPCTSQLKHLRLRNFVMDRINVQPLRAFLEKVARNLEALALEECFITDAQISAILPSLSQCAQLRFFSFYGNCISMATLQNLLRHMARLGHLRRGLYPAPVESYEHEEVWFEIIDPERFGEVLTGVAQVVRDMVTTQKVQICTSLTNDQNKCHFYSLGHDGSWEVTDECLPALSAVPV
ncbi:PRAME family member 12-like [Thomomys bottae]